MASNQNALSSGNSSLNGERWKRKKEISDGWMNRWKIFLYIYFILLLLFSTLSSVASMVSLFWNRNWKLINWFNEKKKINSMSINELFALNLITNFLSICVCVCVVNLRRFSSIVVTFLTTEKCLIKFNEFNESKNAKMNCYWIFLPHEWQILCQCEADYNGV